MTARNLPDTTAGRALGAAPRVTWPREGEIRVYDTTVAAWEERVDEPAMKVVFRGLLDRLRFRGWKVQRDPKVLKNYPSIANGHWIGVKGDLRLVAETCGRTAKVEFYQELHASNPNGGRYDFGKFARLPRREMRTACVVEMANVARKFAELGYTPKPEDFSGATDAVLLVEVLRIAEGHRHESALASFNRGWTSDRFVRDETGWPARIEYKSWSFRDRDGVEISNGDVRYARVDGRLVRGRAYGTVNGSWSLVDAADDLLAHVHANQLFTCDAPEREPRRLVPGQKERLHAEIEKALKAKCYGRVAVLGRVLERMSTPAEAAAQ